MSEIKLTLENIDPRVFFGEKNVNLNLIRQYFADVVISSRGDTIKIKGSKPDTQKVKSALEQMIHAVNKLGALSVHTVEDILAGENPVQFKVQSNQNGAAIVYGRSGRPIKAKTKTQKELVKASEENDVVFVTGPAGTGKTYVAVALAVRALKNKMVKKIVLTRPAIEAGENLGFLPGDLKDKIDPFLRPLYDALDDMFPADKLKYFEENRIIEIAPLAYMRGRTLDHAFIILDEAQNASALQIKMFLTRLGPNAKCIITGDLSQVDLPSNQRSGLMQATKILSPVRGIGFVNFTVGDVVRHRLVKEIINAYDRELVRKEQWKEEQKQKREAERKQKDDQAE